MICLPYKACCDDVKFLHHLPVSGWSVSMSSDGSMLAVGGIQDGTVYDTSRIGATWVFQYDGSGSYRQLGSKLVGTHYIGYCSQGEPHCMCVSCLEKVSSFK